jgi:hypothetical protein
LLGIALEEGKLQITPPTERNGWLRLLLCKLGYSSAELLRLNRVRMYQEVLFCSNVMDTRGTVVDKQYEQKQPDLKRWSWFRFPLQSPPAKDFCLWRHAFLQLRHVRTAPTLGQFTGKGHKIWEWRYLVEENLLLWYHDGGMDIYTPSEVPRYADRPNCCTCLHVDQQPRLWGVICSVSSIVWGCGK